jgi:adenosylhomocysteine nucleosidase
MAISSTKVLPILVVAALGRELHALSANPQPELELLETGEGIANAERNVEDWLEHRSARAVLSIGFAGALSTALHVGDLVVAETVHGSQITPDPNLLAAAIQVRPDGAVHFGTAVTAERIVWQSSEKHALAGLLAADQLAFVDMESTAIAAVCARRGVPFLIVRSISDLFDEDLPLDFNQCRDSDGRVRSSKVMRDALLKPGSISGLLELRKRSQLCAERMAEFVRRLLPFIK